MNDIIFAQENSTTNFDQILNECFKLRHDTFIERLSWDIPSVNGLERDYFDDLSPTHIVIKNDKTINGYWRALPCEGDYMLQSIFPELLQGEDAPKNKNTWEISRFAVRKGSSQSQSGYISNISLDLIQSFYQFALSKQITSYVTVTTVACERLLRQVGLKIRRLGEGKVLKIGVERTVALHIDMSNSALMAK
ncbi:GNAT family N-acetyltransferase [Catenovulum sp. SM1970]|nr:GNAT family N-acetyltransferase [Marinifaba aquimaris]